MPNPVMRVADGHADAAAGLVAGEHGLQEIAAAQVERLRDGPGGGNHDGPWMGNGITVQVVHLDDVGKAAQIEGAACRIAALRGRDRVQDPRRFGLKRAKRASHRVENEKRSPFEIARCDFFFANQTNELPGQTHGVPPATAAIVSFIQFALGTFKTQDIGEDQIARETRSELAREIWTGL